MARIAHGTLAANAVTSVVLDQWTSQVTVINRTKTGEIYFTVDGTDPVVLGSNSYVSLGSRAVNTDIAGATTVKMISSTAVAFSVIGETQ